MQQSFSPALERISPNTRGRDFVVGDIHGHVGALYRLLEHAAFDDGIDRLFSVGDLIDRGPDSEGAVTLLDAPWFTAIRGNHEQMMLDAVVPDVPSHDALALWQTNGGAWYGHLQPERAERLVERIVDLPTALEIERPDGSRVGLVHAEVPDGDWPGLARTLAERPAAARIGPRHQELLWARNSAARVRDCLERGPGWRRSQMMKRLRVTGIDRVYHGHTPMPAPIDVANTRWIDTGVFLPAGALCMTCLDEQDTVWWCPADGRVNRTHWERPPPR